MEHSKKIDISVIMPVYNVADHLEKAIDSLIHQTLKEMEIICVDDGSTDHSMEILERFAAEDDRIKILYQDHAGVGEARNRGLSEALGEYVIFLDSDDFFDITLLEKVVKKGKKTLADVVLFGAKRYDNRTGHVIDAPRYLWRKLLPEQEVFSRKDMNGELFGLTTPSPWTKAFRRQFVLENDIWFQSLPNSNDVRFVMTALAVAERISVVQEDLVFYRVFREGSLQNGKDSNPLCFLDAYEATYDELHRRGIYEDVAHGFCNMVLSGCAYNLDTMHTQEAFWTAARALCSERFECMGLLDFPDEYYDMVKYRDYIKGLRYAIQTREEFENTNKYEPEILVKCGNDFREKKVTVIIAVYNMEKYLSECLESVLRQTLKELEIICIDDGSTDKSLELLLSYAQKDERLSVYRQKNCGLSVTRNRGLKRASGEYVYFIDSDDILDEDALEHLYHRSIENKLDVLYFNGHSFYENEDLKERHPEFEDYYIRKANYPVLCTGTEMFMKMKDVGEYRTNVGIQFFRREFLVNHNIWFHAGILHEDNDFTFRTMLSAKKTGYTEAVYFKRRIRENSIMTENVTFAHVYGYFKSFQNMLLFVEKNEFPEEMTEALFAVLKGVLCNARNRYQELSPSEKYASLGMQGKEITQFRLFIEEDSNTQARLQRTYEEKSEINRKLQITYGEKYERGLKIKSLEKELASIKKSRSYRLARMIGFPIRIFRKMIKQISS